MAEIIESTGKSPKNNNSAATGSVPLSDMFFMTIRRWPWILLSVIVCVGIAYIYLLRTPTVYSRAAEILIKDDGNSQGGGDEFVDLGLFKSKTNIQNEMTNLKAKDLMEEVVRRLGLDMNYYLDGRFHDRVAYGYELPVRLTVDGYPDEGSYSLGLTVRKDGDVTLSHLRETGRDDIKGTFTGQLNDTIDTPLGKMIVSPSHNYQEGQPIELTIRKMPVSATRDSYNARLAVTMSSDKGSVLRLSLSDQSVQRADDVLNTLIGVYNENWIRDRNQIAISTSNFINERLGVIESELGNVDSDISSYKSANLVPDLSAAASMYMSQSQQTQARILEVNNQLSMARYIRSYLSADGNKDQLLPANTGLQSSNIQSLIGEYNERILQRNSLVAKSSERNPLVTQLDEQIDAQRAAIVRTVDNEIIALNTQLKSLRSSEEQTMSKLASNPNQAKNLLSVERQQKVKESLYLFLLQKREENELSQAFTSYNTRIINRPGASGVPPTPNHRNMLAIAFLIGLAIPFGVTYIREAGNTTVRGRKDIEHLVAPFLGEIPLNARDPRKKETHSNRENTILVKVGKRDIINEAFRVLRTNVEFMSASTPGAKIIAFTSFNRGSGKSFISVNLGMSIAIKGKKVLMIDGDMRHGSTSAYIGSPATGLSNYLSGAENDLTRIIVPDRDCPDLSFIPVGSIPPNPTELLESPRLEQMLATLRDRYDYIIIDCPPIEVVADAHIIDRYADRTFFVIRAGLMQRAMLPELDRLYESKKFHNMAFILNGTSNATGRSGYAHSYGYGYGYSYNYGTPAHK